MTIDGTNGANVVNKVTNADGKPQLSEANSSLWQHIKQWLQQLS